MKHRLFAKVLACALQLVFQPQTVTAQTVSDSDVRIRFVDSFVERAEATFESKKNSWSESRRQDSTKILTYLRSLQTDWDSAIRRTLNDVDTDSNQMTRRYHQSFQFYFGDRKQIDQSINSILLEPIIWGDFGLTNASANKFERKTADLVAQWFQLVHKHAQPQYLVTRSHLINKIKSMGTMASSPNFLKHFTRYEFETVWETLDRFTTIDDETKQRIITTEDEIIRPGDWPISTMVDLDSAIYYLTLRRDLMIPTAINQGHAAAAPYVLALARQTRRQLDSLAGILRSTPATQIGEGADNIAAQISDWTTLLPETAQTDSAPSILTDSDDTAHIRRLERHEGSYRGVSVLRLFDKKAPNAPPDASRRLSFLRSALHRISSFYKRRPSDDLSAEIGALKSSISELYDTASDLAASGKAKQ